MADDAVSPPSEHFLDSRDDPHAQARLARETPLLLHSVSEFTPLIKALFRAVKAKRVIEIGGETGRGASAYLAAGAEEVMCVDPMPTKELTERAGSEKRINLVVERSPDCLPSLPPSRFWVIDGDHNYVTVRAELEEILGRADCDGEPLILLHDVLWPCSRRDQYYDPEALDLAAVRPHSWDTGSTVFAEDMRTDGFVGAGDFARALDAGGERNGVRTAIEDVLETRPQLAFSIVPAIFGLGVLFNRNSAWADEVAQLLEPWDRSPLLTRLELNRIALYSRVLELQHELDQHARQFEQQARKLDAEIARLRSERLTARAVSS